MMKVLYTRNAAQALQTGNDMHQHKNMQGKSTLKDLLKTLRIQEKIDA